MTFSLALVLLVAATPGSPALLPLPGGEGGIGLDDLRFSEDLHRLVVPAGRTGRVDLVDPATGAVESVEGFSRSAPGHAGHGEGTTSADAGGRWLFAIDRGDRTVAIVDPGARRIVARVKLAGGPDYVRWVEAGQEVWVTEPDRHAVEIFRFRGGSEPRLTRAATIPVPGGPESLVVDQGNGRAYTNTFGDVTFALDARSHAVVGRWPNGCRGARGIALDAAGGRVLVGCAEGKVVALDVARGGAVVGEARTGEGVDGIAYAPRLGHLYAPASDATLTVVGVGEDGKLHPLGAIPTGSGAHCAAADDAGNVYVCDPRNGRLLVVRDPYPSSRR